MGYTIAICDDDKNMADKLTVSLKNEFMKAGRNDVIIDYYDTGVQLLEALKNKMYKAVLLDINMEPENGIQTARRLRIFCGCWRPGLSVRFTSGSRAGSRWGQTTGSGRAASGSTCL